VFTVAYVCYTFLIKIMVIVIISLPAQLAVYQTVTASLWTISCTFANISSLTYRSRVAFFSSLLTGVFIILGPVQLKCSQMH